MLQRNTNQGAHRFSEEFPEVLAEKLESCIGSALAPKVHGLFPASQKPQEDLLHPNCQVLVAGTNLFLILFQSNPVLRYVCRGFAHCLFSIRLTDHQGWTDQLLSHGSSIYICPKKWPSKSCTHHTWPPWRLLLPTFILIPVGWCLLVKNFTFLVHPVAFAELKRFVCTIVGSQIQEMCPAILSASLEESLGPSPMPSQRGSQCWPVPISFP